MPMIYKVRDPVTKNQWFTASHPQARKILLEQGDPATLEMMEYQYKWQLVVMMNDAYADGKHDATKESV